jgi:tetratricopeptide (TPR) repeat protein
MQLSGRLRAAAFFCAPGWPARAGGRTIGLDDSKEACLSAAQDPAALWQRAERHLAAREHAAARGALEALLAADPKHAMARLRLSMLATQAGRYRESLEHLLAVARLPPEDPELALLVAGMLHRLGEVAEALRLLSMPRWPLAAARGQLLQMAQLAQQMDAMALAGSLLDRADAGVAPPPAALYLRATLQTFAGELDAAESSLGACIARAPAFAPAHWSLSRLRKAAPGAEHTGRLRSLLAAAADPTSQAYLGFALFKELDDLGEHEAAWQALERACADKRAQLDYSPQAEDEAFAVLHALPTSAAAPAEPAGPQPIYVVGMPRTGTTLLERILGGGGEVTNAGELDELPLQLRWQADRFSRSYFDAAVFAAAAQRDPAELGRRYLEHAAWRADGRGWFTDKLPMNFLHVGFIARALPGARILHLVREPMDTCFSNLKELFAEAYPYSYRLDELAAHYGRYRRLMAHWHAAFPGRILDVSYEALVADPERVARGVFAHCGLRWDPASLALGGGGAVSTASTVQVREGIHARRVGGWRAYARQLEPLRQRLQQDGWLPR